jgi:hypothetical protein
LAQCELLRLTMYVCLQRQRAQQIVPCTVSQLMSAAQAEDVFKVGEVEVAQVTQITSVNMRMVVHCDTVTHRLIRILIFHVQIKCVRRCLGIP